MGKIVVLDLLKFCVKNGRLILSCSINLEIQIAKL